MVGMCQILVNADYQLRFTFQNSDFYDRFDSAFKHGSFKYDRLPGKY